MTNEEIFKKKVPFNYKHKSFKDKFEFDQNGDLVRWDIPNIPEPDQDQFDAWEAEIEGVEQGEDKKLKEEQIIKKASSELFKLFDPLGIEERDLWFKQQEEVMLYLQDSSAYTPLITAISSEAGYTLPEISNRFVTLMNSDFLTQAGKILGKKMKDLADLE